MGSVAQSPQDEVLRAEGLTKRLEVVGAGFDVVSREVNAPLPPIAGAGDGGVVEMAHRTIADERSIVRLLEFFWAGEVGT